MKAIGIILAGGVSERLGDLTSVRAASALPVGSCYRVIDFPLSNMSNSGITKIAVITQYNSRSLHDHLNSSKWWDLGRKHGGLYVFTPFLQSDNSFWFRGTADSIYQNIAFLKRSNEPLVVIASGNCVYKMDFTKLINYHVESGADITITAKDTAGTDMDPRDYGVLKLDENGGVTDFEEKPFEADSTIISLGIYVMSRVLLIKLLENVISEARYEFVTDILIRYRKKLRMNAFMFNDYWMGINSIGSYYSANMDFLRKDVRDALVHQLPHIETKPKDEPPAKFNYRTETKNCLIGSGSILNGKAVNSVIFRKVFTGENSFINSSILMEGCFIGNNCVVEHAILDKEVIIFDGKQIRGTPDSPVTIKKGALV
ncbi:MAG: glucose-1-phosphate adenylyltransferase subunit GlgD [Defluviitaleaceae bacterium]|nr:glucose-1-phosphate adenylyltransferase subunit GlgD [Defluviitaleaceae bacterium]MCL2836427.1 glucose-1-phosphate adenylyltransferase subunit GlgD [Defluviitaleaceae bacterium]